MERRRNRERSIQKVPIEFPPTHQFDVGRSTFLYSLVAHSWRSNYFLSSFFQIRFYRPGKQNQIRTQKATLTMSAPVSLPAEIQQAPAPEQTCTPNSTTKMDEKNGATNIDEAAEASASPGHEPTPMPQETYKQLNELPKSLSIVLWLL